MPSRAFTARFIDSCPFGSVYLVWKILKGSVQPDVRHLVRLGIYPVRAGSRRAGAKRILVFSVRGFSRTNRHGGFSNFSAKTGLTLGWFGTLYSHGAPDQEETEFR